MYVRNGNVLKILGVKVVWCVLSDDWWNDVLSVNPHSGLISVLICIIHCICKVYIVYYT